MARMWIKSFVYVLVYLRRSPFSAILSILFSSLSVWFVLVVKGGSGGIGVVVMWSVTLVGFYAAFALPLMVIGSGRFGELNRIHDISIRVRRRRGRSS